MEIVDISAASRHWQLSVMGTGPLKNVTNATNATKSPENRMQQDFARGYLPKTNATNATNCPENRMQQGFALF